MLLCRFNCLNLRTEVVTKERRDSESRAQSSNSGVTYRCGSALAVDNWAGLKLTYRVHVMLQISHRFQITFHRPGSKRAKKKSAKCDEKVEETPLTVLTRPTDESSAAPPADTSSPLLKRDDGGVHVGWVPTFLKIHPQNPKILILFCLFTVSLIQFKLILEGFTRIRAGTCLYLFVTVDRSVLD